MSVDVHPAAPDHSGNSMSEETGMNDLRASAFEWKSTIDATMSAATPLWLVVAVTLAVAAGLCPAHLYI